MEADDAQTTSSSPILEAWAVPDNLPGHSKPLYTEPNRYNFDNKPGVPFPHLLSADLSGRDSDPAQLPLITLRELAMLNFMNAVTDKPDWETKVFDEAITNKWKDEVVAASRYEAPVLMRTERFGRSLPGEDEPSGKIWEETYPCEGMTEAMAQYCIDELRWKASTLGDWPGRSIVVFNGDVVKSDCAVIVQVKEALQRLVKPLEDVSEDAKDWHPGSDGKVLDLVHPSLFPLVYGVSKVLPVGDAQTTLEDCIHRCGAGDVVSKPSITQTTDQSRRHFGSRPFFPFFHGNGGGAGKGDCSEKFQWLPCEVDISGEKARIKTYINNLHPQRFPELYSTIEEVITATIPLWDRTLSALKESRGLERVHRRIHWNRVEYQGEPSWEDFEASSAGKPERLPDERNEDYQKRCIDDEGDEDGRQARYEFYIRQKRRLVLPEPNAPFDAKVWRRYPTWDYGPESPLPVTVDLKATYGANGRPLQIIVKLANIELTPEKPRFEGGSWHIEGQLNERIVATALYYYSSENITPSSLAFRQMSNNRDPDRMRYPQDDHEFLHRIFGIPLEKLNYGGYQSAAYQDVGSVQTKEGRLVTFPNILQHQVQPFELDDPSKPGHRKILALFLVDPEVRIISTAHVPCQQLEWANAQESCEKGEEGGPFSLEKAKAYREELMEERKAFVQKHAATFAASTFSLCEH